MAKAYRPVGSKYIDSKAVMHRRFVLNDLISSAGAKLDGFNGRLSSLNFSKNESQYGTKRFDLLTSSVTDMSDDPGDGYVYTMFWDNNGTYDTQVYFPNANSTSVSFPKMRSKSGGTSWGSWKPLYYDSGNVSMSSWGTYYSQYGGDYNYVYVRRIGDICFLSGLIEVSTPRNNAEDTICVLPSAYRPAKRRYCNAISSSGEYNNGGHACPITIRPNGEIKLHNPYCQGWISFDGISYFL